MEVGAYLVADAQALELVQPGKDSLDYPTTLSQTGVVRGAASNDLRDDAAALQESAVLAEVVASVGVEALRFVAGRLRRPRMCGIASRSGMSWVTSCRLPPVSVMASGVPWRSTITWC